MKPSLHTTRRPILWATLLFVFITAQTTTTKATPETTVKVEPYISTAQIGEMFTVNITLTNVQNLFGIEVSLYWDASILQIVSTDVRLGYPDGVLHEPIWKNETKGEDNYVLYGTSMYRETPSFNGSGNVVRITFNVTGLGSCKLNLESELRDKPPLGGIASPISHTTVDGFFGLIHIFVSPMTVVVGEKVNISGFVIPAQANIEVAVVYRREGETDWRTLPPTVITNEQGNYLYVWQPQEAGKYEIRTTAIIEGTEETSSSVLVSVQAPEQPTWAYIIILIVIVITVIVAAIVIYRKKLKE